MGYEVRCHHLCSGICLAQNSVVGEGFLRRGWGKVLEIFVTYSTVSLCIKNWTATEVSCQDENGIHQVGAPPYNGRDTSSLCHWNITTWSLAPPFSSRSFYAEFTERSDHSRNNATCCDVFQNILCLLGGVARHYHTYMLHLWLYKFLSIGSTYNFYYNTLLGLDMSRRP